MHLNTGIITVSEQMASANITTNERLFSSLRMNATSGKPSPVTPAHASQPYQWLARDLPLAGAQTSCDLVDTRYCAESVGKRKYPIHRLRLDLGACVQNFSSFTVLWGGGLVCYVCVKIRNLEMSVGPTPGSRPSWFLNVFRSWITAVGSRFNYFFLRAVLAL